MRRHIIGPAILLNLWLGLTSAALGSDSRPGTPAGDPAQASNAGLQPQRKGSPIPPRPHDTPIVITGGSLCLDADPDMNVQWNPVVTGNRYKATTGKVLRIAVVNKADKKERLFVKPKDQPWKITLSTSANGNNIAD